MSDAATLAKIAHDVGKYVARAARNVRAGAPVPAPLVAMLAKDLYETRAGRRASAVLAELTASASSASSTAVAADPRIARAATLLAEADQLEPRVRAADTAALQRAVEIALEVESLLRSAARDGAA